MIRSQARAQAAIPALAPTPARRLPRLSGGVALSLGVLLLLTAAVLLADVLAPTDPTQINLRARLSPPLTADDSGVVQHWLGTDATGRDILSRLLHGGRVSLFLGAAATVLGLIVGAALGLVSGYARGWFDELIMYLVDVQLALPFLLLAVAVALVLGRSLAVLLALAAFSTWPLYARVVRGEVLSLREREFVVAARALGAGHGRILLLHLLPNLAAALLVLATINIGRIILLESALSFLGIGILPPNPSWGSMMNEGRDYLTNAPWLAAIPGAALIVLTLAIGALGDWLRDRLDVTTAR